MGCKHKNIGCTAASCKRDIKVFIAMANTNRFCIAQALSKGAMNVTQITQLTGIEQTCISHNLKVLEKEGLVLKKKTGKFRVYTLTATAQALLQVAVKKK
jgi:predicted transcriptional regulator